MPLPPKGSPQRPLRLAIRSTRILGILFLIVGTISTFPMLYFTMRRAGGPRPSMVVLGAVVAGALLLYLVPGAFYIVCSVFMGRRRMWAIVTAMVVAGIHLLVLIVGQVTMLISWTRGASVPWIPALILLIFTVAVAQLEFHLARSFEAIRMPPIDEQRGFEVPFGGLPVHPPSMNRDDASDGGSAMA